MKSPLKVLIGLGLIAIALFWWFSNPARAPRRRQPKPTSVRPAVQLVAQQVDTSMVTEFKNAEEANLWRSVDDVVMGGVSQSGLRVTSDETGLFSGELSLENNGGFASVRRTVEDVDFAGVRAISLRVKGDGRPYQLRLQTKTTNDTISYRSEFETTAGEWIELRLPIADMEPVFRGEVVPGAPELSPSDVKQIGFLLADKQPGAFRLETDWIRLER